MPVENKGKTIGFRVTQTERKQLQAKADKWNMRLTDFVRWCVFGGLSDKYSRRPHKSKP